MKVINNWLLIADIDIIKVRKQLRKKENNK